MFIPVAGPVTRADVLLVVIPEKGCGIARSVFTAYSVLPVCASLLVVSVGQLEIVEDAPQVLPRVGEPLVLADGDRRVLELGHGQVELLNLNAYDNSYRMKLRGHIILYMILNLLTRRILVPVLYLRSNQIQGYSQKGDHDHNPEGPLQPIFCI